MRTLFRGASSFLIVSAVWAVAPRVSADGTPQTLPFSQDWTVTTQITANNDWSGVPGIVGYNGAGMGTSGTADPQTLLGIGTEVVFVLANQTSTTITTGGVAEFDSLPNPSVAFQASGTAGAPNIVITVVTTGHTNITVAYLLRDLDAVDDAVQHVALQYRVGTTGSYTNIAAGYVVDATAAGGATLTTPVSVVLPVACENQPLVEIRVITANAPGSDEWVGIDDITISSTPTTCGNGTMDAGETCDTGALNGTTPCGCTTSCSLAASGTMCAASGGMPCDAPDTCDGAGACASRVAAMGTSCRASTGLCDPAETCDGVALTCPADVLSATGTMCRAAAGACDVADTCDGTTAACTDASAANGTACDDGLVCNGADMCMTGSCMHAGAPDCTDTNACTLDMCVEATPMCTHVLTAAPACCNDATECDDGDACTTNSCTHAGGVCTFDPIADCCASSAQCDDGNPCTLDTCDTGASRCTHMNECDAATPHDAGTLSDTGMHDAGAGDASHADGSTTGSDAGHTTPHTSSGCACATGSRSGSEGLAALALLALGLVSRRRRFTR